MLDGCCVTVTLTDSSSHLCFSFFVGQRDIVYIQSDITKSYEKYNMKNMKKLS